MVHPPPDVMSSLLDDDQYEPETATPVAPPASIPASFLDGARDDERAELAHLIGVPLREAPDAELAATASQLLTAIKGQSAELERYAEAERAEIARVQSRYDAVKARLADRIQFLEQQLAIVAEGLEYGKKKSRTLGNGSVGWRTNPERVAVTDGVALVGWAGQHAPDLVRKEVKLSVPQSAAKEWFQSTGELPEGCDLVPASRKLVYSIAVETAD